MTFVDTEVYRIHHKTNITVSCCYLVVTMEILIGPLNPCESMNKSLAAWISQHTLLLHQLTHNSPKQTCQKIMQVFCEKPNLDSKTCAKGQLLYLQNLHKFCPIKSVEFSAPFVFCDPAPARVNQMGREPLATIQTEGSTGAFLYGWIHPSLF